MAEPETRQDPLFQKAPQKTEGEGASPGPISDSCGMLVPTMMGEARTDGALIAGQQMQGESPHFDLQHAAQQLLKNLRVEQLDHQTCLHLELSSKKFSWLGLDLHWVRGRIHAQFKVDDERHGALLRSAVCDLPTEFQQRGMPLDRVNVALGSQTDPGQRQPLAQDGEPRTVIRRARRQRCDAAKLPRDAIDYEA